ncbi:MULTISPECIES: LysE family translocator [unclassified Pseudomonas]|uniref:LysE family translocator n=1 Tax=unclassified Pseudomonas TaxID=196821 RepID=UPI000A1F4621|nr:MULTISPECIES: LysE family translocator [unclassified Pseudomonas]POA58293.1 lysine transporter LysE [Pseudomonas sp. FW507-12TSA]
MNLTTLVLFLPACFALNMAPGPNNLLSVKNATTFGFRVSCLAGVGRLLAFMLMIGLASVGLAAVLQASELLFHGIKILGAGYLLYLAYRLWTADTRVEVEGRDAAGGLLALARQEFLIAIGNPKAILVFSAFLPQFIDPTAPVAGQFLMLGGLFLVLECVAIAAYAGMGLHMRRWFGQPAGRRVFNRGCAVLLSGAASLLLLARRA